MNATITSIGVYHPEREIRNSYFETFLDTSDEWIRERTGIKHRFYAADDEYTSDMCVQAVKALVRNSGKNLSDVDFIIVATSSMAIHLLLRYLWPGIMESRPVR